MSIVERERVEEVVAPREVTEADVLERAADLLEEFGWCQDHLGSKKDGMFCVLGAVMEADSDLGGTSYHRVDRFLPGESWIRLVHWNNDSGRTKAEVVTALRTAAQKARES